MAESNYTKINNNICPECGGKLIPVEGKDGDFKKCSQCGLHYKFIDDMGPGTWRSYRPTPAPPSITEIMEELWDECSSFVDSDIDSLQSVAGTTVLTRIQFIRLTEKLGRQLNKK